MVELTVALSKSSVMPFTYGTDFSINFYGERHEDTNLCSIGQMSQRKSILPRRSP